jgi:predicted TIM-barrel fold metal-dependent hydrolase
MAYPYRVISGDGHLEIPPQMWTDHVPRAWRDRAPRLIKLPNGGDAVVMEGRDPYVLGLAMGGKPYEERNVVGEVYEDNPGTGGPEQRVREQDQDGVDAEILYHTHQTMWRGIREDAGYKALIHAFNEFLAEEYCAYAPERLIGMGLIPDTNVDDAIAELEYCARAGLKGIMLRNFPNGKGYPLPEDDRFWAAALDLNIGVTAHSIFGGQGSGPTFKYTQQPGAGEVHTSGADPVGYVTRFSTSMGRNMAQMMFTGVFERFPALRIYFAETQAGWLPHFLFQADDNYARTRFWGQRSFGLNPLPQPPSEYIHRHAVWGFLRDPVGVALRHEVGVQNLIWGTDFPHQQGDWPNSRAVIEESFANVPDDERYAMLAGNAIDFFHLEKAEQ